MNSGPDNNQQRQMTILFHYAKQLMEKKEYATAARLFQILTTFNDISFDYWYQLGKCCQALTIWTDAIYAYGRAAQLRITEAEVHCCAAECYLAKGDKQYAEKAFRASLLIIGDDSTHESLRQRVNAGLSSLADRQ